MNSVFANLPVSVFEVMSRLAREQDAVNLGQGFPDGPFPEDVLAKAADAVVSRDKAYHSTLRTTCVTTLVKAGHAENALPQRATAIVNCRIFPGETVEATLATLQRIAGPGVTVTANQPVRPVAKPPALDPKIVEPATRLAAKHFPGVPVLPTMSTGATDAVFFGALGIPVYGVPGMFVDKVSGVHGLNERIRVKSLHDGRDYLHDLVLAYAG